MEIASDEDTLREKKGMQEDFLNNTLSLVMVAVRINGYIQQT